MTRWRPRGGLCVFRVSIRRGSLPLFRHDVIRVGPVYFSMFNLRENAVAAVHLMRSNVVTGFVRCLEQCVPFFRFVRQDLFPNGVSGWAFNVRSKEGLLYDGLPVVSNRDPGVLVRRVGTRGMVTYRHVVEVVAWRVAG